MDHTNEEFKTLHNLLEGIYLPLEKNSHAELSTSMKNFSSQIITSLSKASASNLDISELPDFVEADLKGDSIIKGKVETVLDKWRELIENTLKRLDSEPKAETALGEIDFWRNRTATLSAFNQQLTMPSVKKKFEILRGLANSSEVYISNQQPFNNCMNNLSKEFTKAKVNVKFLQTLERHFKVLNTGTLTQIEESLSSLMNGLRLVYTISRHLKEENMVSILSNIAKEIADKVSREIDLNQIFKIKTSEEEAQKPIELLDKAFRLLTKWREVYLESQKKESDSTEKHWEFNTKLLFSTTDRMANVCFKLRGLCEEVKNFFIVLGPDLKAVISDSDEIDNIRKEVQNFDKLLTFPFVDPQAKKEENPVFTEETAGMLNDQIIICQKNFENLDNRINMLIDKTFKEQLKSSEGAFDLLRRFKNINQRKEISKNLEKKYENILEKYEKELQKLEEIFDRDKSSPPIAKNSPEIAGIIQWVRSIYGRAKRPMVKFSTKPELFEEKKKLDKDGREIKEKSKGYEIKRKYIDFVSKKLQVHEDTIYETWLDKSKNDVIKYLQMTIIDVRPNSDPEAPKQYFVNFDFELIKIIREAKYLDRLGKHSNKVILNVAHMEDSYIQYIEELETLIKNYDQTVTELKKVERVLFIKEISELAKTFLPGHTTYNWTSLGIHEFVESCQKQVNHFRDRKASVMQKVDQIKEAVEKISKAKIITDYNWELDVPMDLMSFYKHFEKDADATTLQLVKECYEPISENYLRGIESNSDKSQLNTKGGLERYYAYWERMIFNAITKATIRAIASIKALFNPPMNSKRIPLFKISADYQSDVQYNPNKEDIDPVIKKIRMIPLEFTKKFVRWRRGSINFCQRLKPELGEKEYYYTFFNDINKHPVVYSLQEEITKVDIDINNGIKSHKDEWSLMFKENSLHDSSTKTKIEKIIDKCTTPSSIEAQIIKEESKKQKLESKTEKKLKFFSIDNTKIINTGIRKIDESISALLKGNFDYATRELEEIQKEFNTNQEKMQQVPSIENIKSVLQDIDRIKITSKEMEFKIAQVKERCNILTYYKKLQKQQSIELDKHSNIRKYDDSPAGKLKKEDKSKEEKAKVYEDLLLQEYLTEAEIHLVTDVEKLDDKWNELLKTAKNKDISLKELKKQFAETTKNQVDEFQKQIEATFNDYLEKGPGAETLTLELGCESLKNYIKIVAEYNSKKNELVLAEKLFNIPITSFPKLNQIEEKNKTYGKIYTLFEKLRNGVKEYSTISWAKLDSNSLTKSSEDWEREAEKMKKDYSKEAPFDKLVKEIAGFKDMLPVITLLKFPYVKEEHWDKIMVKINRKEVKINLKTITLEQVFQLELYNHRAVVEEIVEQARNENQISDALKKLEADWKIENFEVKLYCRDKEQFPILKSSDHIKETLEYGILNLQAISNNRFAGAFLNKIRKWEKDLNQIGTVMDLWYIVQRKWMYLESIFCGSADIRQTLSEDAKKFDDIHKRFKKIMEATYKGSNVYDCCIKAEDREGELRKILADLDKRQKNLTSYLETKKVQFSRFYFISDDELLAIIGDSNPLVIQPYMTKLYDNCKKLIFRGASIVGMESEEGETFDFKQNVKPDGPIEEWMGKVDNEMKKTLHILTKEGVFEYAKMERIEWIMKHLGMITLSGDQIWWTFDVEDVFRKVRDGDKHAMKKEASKQTREVDELINTVRTDIDSKVRRKINVMIIVDVHSRDIVDRFVRDSILSDKEFEWESQLRFYWHKDKDDITVKQCTGVFECGYEYEGLNSRLVITPLTDRCVLTLTTALTFRLGGAPAGPAGTGKTETVKDLAKGLSLRCVVVNCGEGLDHEAMAKNFSGLVQTGFWGCFDEFNRITPEVLSVVAGQIKAIQNALIAHKDKVELKETDLRLMYTVGIFVTMNPGYAGRTELPENVKALFRPVTMIVPNMNLICEIMLMSEGFNGARVLAKKMNVLYKLASEQLSKQYHYDFGLRALKAVLVMAGELKRAFQKELPEDVVLFRALRDMNMPKFVFEDVPLFTGLLQDLFPKLKCESVGYQVLKQKIVDQLNANGMKPPGTDEKLELIFESQVKKVMQLYETMETRHTTMVVGPTGGGKTVIIYTLKEALYEYSKEKDTHPEHVRIDVLNSKAITINELYGVMDPVSRDWTDGLLSKIFRDMNAELPPDKPEKKWILYDSDVDAKWVENMNSVMDDSKLLTLPNSERIKLQKHSKMLYEVFDLQYASPATISRCGMVYVDPKNLSYEPYYDMWARLKNKGGKLETLTESLRKLFAKYVPLCIDYVLEGKNGEEFVPPPKFINPRTNLNMIKQLCDVMDSLLPAENPPQEEDLLEDTFLFAITWSIGACLLSDSRTQFDDILKRASGRSTNNLTFFEVIFNNKTRQWESWEKRMAAYNPPPKFKFNQIIVPTIDTVRYSYLLSLIVKLKTPVMFIGESGTAKTVIINSLLNAPSKEPNAIQFTILSVNFSSRTTSQDFQTTFEESIEKKGIESYDKRSFRTYGPSGGKPLIVFVDDLNMPKIDLYGTQQPIALLKFLIEKKLLYQRGGELELRMIKDAQYVGSMTPPNGENNPVDPRFMSIFDCFNITFPSPQTVKSIYESILTKHMEKNFNQELIPVATKIAQMTYEVYKTITDKLPRTPMKFHYIFNMRDMSRVFQGLCLSTPDKFNNEAKILRLWRNECTRVFADRLINEEDRKIVISDIIPSQVKNNFAASYDQVMKEPMFFGDFSLTNPEEKEAEDPRLYDDLGSMDEVRDKLDKLLESYNDHNTKMSLVLFSDALDHCIRIHRIIRMPRGNALLIGIGGSGKQSLSKLATYIAGFMLWQIKLKRNYKENDFKDDLKSLYKLLLKNEIVFLFTDRHIVEESFLELINNMLTVGMVPGLFAENEKQELTTPFSKEMEEQEIQQTKESSWAYFVNKVRDKFHIVLAMSPAGEALRKYCRNFPGLVSSTSINWFFTWPKEALEAVTTYFLKNEALPESCRAQINEHIVRVHLSILDYSAKYYQEFKRRNYATPKHFLDFIESYRKQLKDSSSFYKALIKRLEGGLQTLKKASEDTEILSKQLEARNQDIQVRKTDIENLIKNITENAAVAKEQSDAANKSKIELEVKKKEISVQQEEANKILQDAIPAEEKAKLALNNLSDNDITMLKQMKNPKDEIKLVIEITYIFYLPETEKDKPNNFDTAKKEMFADVSMLKSLKDYSKDRKFTMGQWQSDRAEEKLKKLHTIYTKENKGASYDDLIERVRTMNPASGNLLSFGYNIISYYKIAKTVKPKREKVARLTAELNELMEKLKETEENIQALNEKIATLTEKRNKSEMEFDILKKESAAMQKKLNAASKLISGLGSEQKRWGDDVKSYQDSIIKLVGDCLVGSAFLSYIGPFNFQFRKKMLVDDWPINISGKGIPLTANLNILTLLTSEVEISRWASEGLPQDELSLQNGILTTKGTRFPLCIDPQLQAINWIKVKEKKGRDAYFLTFNSEGYMKKVQLALTSGNTVVFESVEEELDPMIDPILEKNYKSTGGLKTIKLGEEAIDWNDQFRLFLTTKLSNPNFTPEVMGKCLVINFTVTMQGLQDQLLNVVVEHERIDLEQKRKQLIIETSENKQKLKEYEDILLKELANNTGSLVDNVSLIETLENTKNKASEIKLALEQAQRTKESIEESSSVYRPAAKQGSILLFAMFGLRAISEMYEYSLTSYLEVFKGTLKNSKKDAIAKHRIHNIIEKLTENVYKYTCMGIFERHKLLFSFQMITMIMDGNGQLNRAEFEFFLKGNTSIETITEKKPSQWISDRGWKDLQKLISIKDEYKNLKSDIENNISLWKTWYDKERPEVETLPLDYQEKLSKFQRLLLIRVMRPDRVINAIKQFIISQSEEKYVQSPSPSPQEIFLQSNEKTPILYILSPGADPLGEVQKLAFQNGLDSKFKFLSLGQGTEEQAKQRVLGGVLKGHWVMLMNCHLLTSWLKPLEQLIEEKMQKPHTDFRLWLTTEPTDKFPLGVLQKSLKIVTEPPDGMRLNIINSFSKIDDKVLCESQHEAYKPLIYVLSFFHAVIQERRKFGKIGWNIIYAFNESDFTFSCKLLSMYLNKALENHEDSIPWNSLRYLIGEAMYGGRVTDDFDRRVLVTYLSEYMGDFLFDKNLAFNFYKSPDFIYGVPQVSTIENINKYLGTIPLYNSPEVFGLHPNAEISYFTNSAKSLWTYMIDMQSSASSSSSGVNKDEYVAGVATDIQSKLPPQFDRIKISKSFPLEKTPTQVVLIQEIDRFNMLIEKMTKSLINIKRAIYGEIGMNTELDELSSSLYNGFLPNSWRELAPQTEKLLSSWIQHFEKRYELYKDWSEKAEPIVMWLSGLHIPESYLTALVQTTCRAKGWALDKSTLYTMVTKYLKPNEISERLPQGCYISGLYLEGAKWDTEKGNLQPQDPKELVCEMPIMQIIPIEATKLKLRNMLETPVYVTQNRRNAMGRGLVFEANLNTELHPSHWVLQGVALMLNTDQ